MKHLVIGVLFYLLISNLNNLIKFTKIYIKNIDTYFAVWLYICVSK